MKLVKLKRHYDDNVNSANRFLTYLIKYVSFMCWLTHFSPMYLSIPLENFTHSGGIKIDQMVKMG